MTVYAPGDPLRPGEYPALLAIGDSWFWYPANNVLEALARHPCLLDGYRHIQALGFNGAKLEEYVFGKHSAALARQLQPGNRQYYSAVLISGAGNDAVDYRLGLFQDCSQANALDECVDEDGMDELLSKVGAALGALIHRIWSAFGRDGRHPDIFLHSYDYPVPDGRGFTLGGLISMGPWLARAMDDAKVPADMVLRRAICRTLIDRLHEQFAQFADPAKKIHLIDSRGCLQSPNYRDDWANELHPSSSGFARIVEQRWLPVLDAAGYARRVP